MSVLVLPSLLIAGCFEDTDTPINVGEETGATSGAEISGIEAGAAGAGMDLTAGELGGVVAGVEGGDIVITPPRELSIATYNVQNLFDFVDNPERDEGEFTPNIGDWSMRTYSEKVSAIAEVIKLIDADIVVLQEVEEGPSDSDNVLVALTQEIRAQGGRDYTHIAQSPTRDFRGITLGILSIYPISREIGRPIDEVISCQSGDLLDGSSPEARPIYEINLWSDGSGGGNGGGAQSLTLLAHHWRSRREFETDACPSSDRHERGARQLKSLLTEWLDPDPQRAIMVLGDFNTTEDDTALSESLDAHLSVDGLLKPSSLYNLWGELGVNTTTVNNVTNSSYRYGGEWFRLDHMMISRSMTQRGGWSLVSFELINDSQLLSDGAPNSWSNRTQEGYSDHLPLKVLLRKDD